MKKDQIIYVAALRAASILGLVAALLSVVAVPFMFLLSQFGTQPWHGIPLVMFMTVPLSVAFLSFLFVFIGCLVYNLVAKFVGGIAYASTKAGSA